MNIATGKGRPGALICALGLVICLMGCQSRVYKAPLPPPIPPAAAAPIPRPVRSTLYVNINQLGLRACPGKDCRKISTLELNAEVEKMGEIDKWTQIKVKKDGNIGYVNTRYLSPNPVQVGQLTKRKAKKTKSHKVVQHTETAREEGEPGAQEQDLSPSLPKAM